MDRRRDVSASSEFASLELGGRIEPELPRGFSSAISSDSPPAGGLSTAASEADAEPRLFNLVSREAPLLSEASHRVLAERPNAAKGFLLLVGLVIAGIVGVYFGISFSLLTRSNDKTIAAAGPESSGGQEATSTPTVATAPNDPPPGTVAAAETAPAPAPAPDATPHEPAPPAPPPQASGSPVDPGFARLPDQPTRSASGGNRSRAHSATGRGGSAHHQAQPSSQVKNEQIFSAAPDRAHRGNFSDSSATLTPPRAGARSPFDELITNLTGQAKPPNH